MENKKIGQHISRQFNEEMENIRNMVLTMGGLVEQQIEQASKSFMNSDLGLAERVIQQDDLVDNLQIEIDQECTEILAKRQPAAFDLRMLMATTKIITDLERIGDEAARIAKMTIRLESTEYNHDRYHEIRHLLELVKDMVHASLNSVVRMDVNDAVAITSEDLKIDQEYGSIIRQLITRMMEDPRNITRSLDVLWTARSLERMGDHSCNICEHVIYMVKGKDVRHISQDELEKVMEN
jgi:phosphate transport system protein